MNIMAIINGGTYWGGKKKHNGNRSKEKNSNFLSQVSTTLKKKKKKKQSGIFKKLSTTDWVFIGSTKAHQTQRWASLSKSNQEYKRATNMNTSED